MKSRLYGPGLHQSFPVCSPTWGSTPMHCDSACPILRDSSPRVKPAIGALFVPHVTPPALCADPMVVATTRVGDPWLTPLDSATAPLCAA
jgi:hypothetical protein